uniref:Peroxin-5 n=2 Tax=Lotharella globosa TaxID=91324 RepID=A0A7S3YUE3_9EUKA|mmetsp:Transcript_6010/g.11916  ORF Transcript_6010/g.11916 Transcript_6010/m.11916 type:complete len:671 (-) Transcript_6010:218-2230(-)
MLRDLATGESCGQQNALAGFANNLGKQGQQIADAKQFSGVNVPPGMSQFSHGPGGPVAMNMGRPVDAAEANAFMRGARMNMPSRMQSAAPTVGRIKSADQMAKEFQAMSIHRQQSAQFERAFSESKGQAPAPTMIRQQSAPFAPPQQQQAGSYTQMHGQMPMQQHFGAPMWAPQMMSMGPMTPMQGGMQRVNVPTVNEVENLFSGVQAPKAPLSEPLHQEPPAQERPMGGMGLSSEMINKLMNSDNPKWRNSKFLKFLNQVNRGEITFKDNKVVHNDLKHHQQAAVPEPANPMAAMSGEKMAMPGEQQQDMEQDLGASWAAEFANAQQDAGEAERMQDWRMEFEKGLEEDQTFSQYTPPENKDPVYVMQQNNPYFKEQKDTGEAFKKGLALMKDGNLKEAIQAFEADVTHHPEHAEGWRYLGQCHADEEEERPAIAALLKCLECDPYNLPALMMLGVSYTNDLEEARALNYLKTWLENNPSYSTLKEIKTHSRTIREFEKLNGGNMTRMDTNLSDTVMQMFLAALRANPEDADLHTVVGVLHHLSDNYDMAIEHFSKGCKLRPNDPYLWNKLGATQANSSRSKMAVGAYQRALGLKQNYMRARTNLAIAYANQDMHDKACVHYLKALRQNAEAAHVWGYLKISLSSVGRGDLIPLVERRDVGAFEKHFRF